MLKKFFHRVYLYFLKKNELEETKWWLLDQEELRKMINENKNMMYQSNKYFTEKLLRS